MLYRAITIARDALLMHAVGAPKHWLDGPAAVERLRWRRLPMLAAAVCFAGGVVCARQWVPPLWMAGATAVLFVLACVSWGRVPRAALVAALGFWVAVGCWCAEMQPPVPRQLALRGYADGLSRMVRGRVVRVRTLKPVAGDEVSRVQPWEMEPGAWEASSAPELQSVDLAVEQVEDITPDVAKMAAVEGGVRVTVQGGALAVRCGDVAEAAMRLRTPEVYRDPGAWSYSDELLQEGIGATGAVKVEKVNVVGVGARSLKCRLFAAQAWAAGRMQAFVDSAANRPLPALARLSAEDAAMLNAMLFGDRSRLSHALRAGFERTGTFHLFVVSGLHVALLAGALFWVLRRLRVPQGAAVGVTIALATAYALLTGFGVPVQRALVMTAVYLLARWLDRSIPALNALGAAALAVMVMDPRALMEASFQMTFLVIVAVAGLASPLMERFIAPWARATRNLDVVRVDAYVPPRYAEFRVRLRMMMDLMPWRLRGLPVWVVRGGCRVADAVVIGVAAEVCMVVPMAIYFHRATLLALPLNLLDIPLVSALVCLAVVTFCASLSGPGMGSWLAVAPGAATAVLLHVVRWTVERSQHVGVADLRLPAPAPVAIGAACVAIALACWALRERRRVWVAVGAVAMLAAPLAMVWPARPLLHAGVLEVTAIDVGQGDSLLVVSPSGSTMLVDAGGPVGRGAASAASAASAGSAASPWDVGEEVVAPYLWTRRIRRLDVVALTHAHSDHMGGMPAVLRDFRPRELWLSVEPGNSPGLQALLAQARAAGIVVRHFHAGDTFAWGGLQASVLAPEVGYGNLGAAHNNDSLVMRLQDGKASVLLEGDAEAPSEAVMVANGRVEPVTLLKVGHHGSKTSTTAAFLAAASPAEAVISVGQHNTFGHPRGDVLARLEGAHVKTYRTDRSGAETFLLSGDGGVLAVGACGDWEEGTAEHLLTINCISDNI